MQVPRIINKSEHFKTFIEYKYNIGIFRICLNIIAVYIFIKIKESFKRSIYWRTVWRRVNNWFCTWIKFSWCTNSCIVNIDG